ncbi:MAG: flagellar hook-length control protein FliK [bacterium]|nr:flagellar hook-length control protein FliK [bacterium]
MVIANNNMRVDSDPMRIPTPARMTTDDDAFVNALEEATPRQEEPQPEAEDLTDIDDELADVAPEGETAPERASEEQLPEPATEAGEALVEPKVVRASEPALPTESNRAGESGRQQSAGKGTDSPRALLATRDDAMLDEIAAHGARNAATNLGAAGQPGTPVTPTQPAGDPIVRGASSADNRAQSTATPARALPAFRTSATATAQLLDQARESIFKQIMLKLTQGGGEMRMRLDPPEFGELDLRLVVEQGNRLTLSIAAERAELADLIQQHVDELRETLAGAGIELEHADISARDRQDGDAANDLSFEGGDDAAEDEPTLSTSPRAGGYIRADGLDFWV